ncbi:MAG: hypothetical protein UY67_C0016G0023 [Candidatus Kaiserbacteria bacterium GW2011_GWA2_52_12]|uniref:Uncharacterized protein n=1 Tax=Candidatus Kaiserbacteria bacterium GW2011_GWA2_52_12 TaxID=1618671 RepID=A0A0G1WYL1_9BACT|nr:MAG: hypothetical protein UY67_C0016G0023 [Candidatus Kaiserbacteria bacterium GW2011_GWA2_52_12]
MNNNVLMGIGAIVLIAIVVAAFILWGSRSQPVQGLGDIVNQGVLPAVDGEVNVMKNKPDVNPVDASNPYRSLKTNPFE